VRSYDSETEISADTFNTRGLAYVFALILAAAVAPWLTFYWVIAHG